MVVPSGDQFGKVLMVLCAVAWRTLAPSASITKISLLFVRSETKAISVSATPGTPVKAPTTSSAIALPSRRRSRPSTR